MLLNITKLFFIIILIFFASGFTVINNLLFIGLKFVHQGGGDGAGHAQGLHRPAARRAHREVAGRQGKCFYLLYNFFMVTGQCILTVYVDIYTLFVKLN